MPLTPEPKPASSLPMRAPLIVLLAALAATVGVILFWGVQQHRALLTEQVSAAAGRSDADATARALRSSERARLAAETTVQGLHEMNPQRLFTDGHVLASPEVVEKFNAAADADPLWGPFHRKLERRRILARYTILFAALKIAPAAAGPLEDLLVERAIISRRPARRQNGPGAAAESAGVPAETPASIDAKIVALVGKDVARQVREWNSAIYFYGNAPDGPVGQDAVSLLDAGYTPSTDQLVRLALIRHEVLTLRNDSRGGGGGVDPNTGLSPLDERLLAREAEVLSPEEVSVLRQWAIEEHKARAALEAVKAAYHIESDRPVR